MMSELNKSEIKALISLLEDEDREVSRHIEQKIMSLGMPIVPFLEHEWEENLDPVVQHRIEDLIHRLQFDSLKDRLRKWVESEEKDLLAGMCLLATYQYPDLQINEVRQQVDKIFMECWLAFRKGLHPFDEIKILNSIFFGKFRFSANTRNFHSPANSLINTVVESRKGNPLSLSVLYMIVAQKLGMPVEGVNLPNIFILTYLTDKQPFYINPFNRGLIFSKEDIAQYISSLNLSSEEAYFKPCSKLQILQRACRNLIQAYFKTGSPEKGEEVKELLEILETRD
jgi:regulator of sirC expression with transglutaminase-like and TPR domain